jgi:hypothetical protein
MATAGFVRRPRLHKPFLGLGVLLRGGFPRRRSVSRA